MARARCSVFPKVESYMIKVFMFSPPSHVLHERSSTFSPQDVDTSVVFSSHNYIPLWNVIRRRHEVITNEHFKFTCSSHFYESGSSHHIIKDISQRLLVAAHLVSGQDHDGD